MNKSEQTCNLEKRYEAIEKIFNLIQEEFAEEEVTAAFTKKLLLDAVGTIDTRVMFVPLKSINNRLKE